MKRSCLFLLFTAAVLLLAGCSPYGIVYTHIKKPLDTNMSRTLVDDSAAQGDIKHIRVYVDVMWDSNAIGDIAKKHGIETVHYADMETLSVLGVWHQYTVHVYGR